jgi:hypothetical protein
MLGALLVVSFERVRCSQPITNWTRIRPDPQLSDMTPQPVIDSGQPSPSEIGSIGFSFSGKSRTGFPKLGKPAVLKKGSILLGRFGLAERCWAKNTT